MKKLTLSLAILAMAGVASAAVLVPNGDFEAGSTSWSSFNDGTTIVSYEVSGGNGGGYGQLDATAGSWGAGFVSPQDNEYPGNDGIPLSYFGLGISGGDTITVTADMITLSGTSIGGMKVESWGGGGYLDNHGGDIPATGMSPQWETYTWDITLHPDADAIKIVPLLTWNYAPNAGSNVDSVIGFDNVGIVPEPATLGLLGLAGGAMFVIRRFRG